MRTTVLTIVSFFALAFGTKAQSDTLLNKDVIVVREYNPIISDANKIVKLPTLEKQEEFTPEFTYSIFNKPLNTAFEIDPITPASLGREPVLETKQNYASFGIGNFPNFNGELFYNAFSSSRHNLSFLYKHNSSWGDVTLPDDTKSFAQYAINEALLSYDRFYDRSYLSANFSFKDMAYRYYGYETTSGDDDLYLFKEWDPTDSIALGDIHNETRAGYTNYNVNFTFGTLASNYEELAYKIHVNYDNFSTRFNLSDNAIALNGFLSYPMDNKTFGADLDGEYHFYKLPSDTLRVWDQADFLDLELTPFFKWKASTWDVKAGIGINFFAEESSKTKAYIVPDIRFNYNIIEKYFTSYFLIGGDYKTNHYSEILYENRFISPNLKVSPTKTPVRFELGMKGFLTPKLVFNGSVGFDFIKDQYFFVNEFYKNPTEDPNDDTDDYVHSNLFRVETDNMNKLSIKASMDYTGNEKFDFGIKGAYYNYSLDKLENPTNMPEYVLGAYASYKPLNNLKVKAGFNTIGKRYALTTPGVNSDYSKLSAVYDIALSGEYDYTKRVGLTINVNNLIASKYDFWYGYPAHRFNITLGAKYRF